MKSSDNNTDINDLISSAETLTDRLEVIAHSQRLKLIAIATGFYALILVAVGLGYMLFTGYSPNVRLGYYISDLSPLLLVFVLFAGIQLCVVFYRLSLDRVRLRLVRDRIARGLNETRLNITMTEDLK